MNIAKYLVEIEKRLADTERKLNNCKLCSSDYYSFLSYYRSMRELKIVLLHYHSVKAKSFISYCRQMHKNYRYYFNVLFSMSDFNILDIYMEKIKLKNIINFSEEIYSIDHIYKKQAVLDYIYIAYKNYMKSKRYIFSDFLCDFYFDDLLEDIEKILL